MRKLIYVFFVIFLVSVATSEIIKSDEVANWAEEHSKSPFTFVVFGDSRPVCENTPIPEAFLKRVFKEISWIDPSFVIHMGDVIYGYGESPSRIDEEFSDFLKLYRENAENVPMIVIPANHDVQPSEYSFKKFKELFGKLLYYDFFYGKSHFIILNTNFPKSIRGDLPTYGFENLNDGYHKKKMRDWLREVIKEKAEHTFIVTHVPMFSIKGEHRYKNANKEFMKIIKKADAYFAAHRHFIYESVSGKTKLFIIGGGGATIDREAYTDGPEGIYAYLVANVNGGYVDYNFVVPFSIDVVRDGKNVYVINRTLHSMLFRGVELDSMPKASFVLKGSHTKFTKVKVRRENGKMYATVLVPARSVVLIKESGSDE